VRAGNAKSYDEVSIAITAPKPPATGVAPTASEPAVDGGAPEAAPPVE